MKPCTRCGEHESVVDLTHLEGGQMKTHHLCAKCAAEKGIETPASLADSPLGGLIAGLGVGPGSGAEAAGAELICPRCGASLQDFRDTGRLGCSACYETFAEPLAELLRRLHGSAHHTGRTYQPPGIGSEVDADSEAPVEAAANLRERLRRAIESEQFELAAELRDRLKEQE